MVGLYFLFMKHFFSRMRNCTLAALLILLWLAAPAAWAQVPAWQSAVAAQNLFSSSASSYSYVFGMATDANDNVYLTGEYQGSVAFGNTTLVSTPLGFDVFVAKWSNTNHRFVWAVSMGGTNTDNSGGIALSGNNVYVTGSFFGATANFGPLTLTNSGNGFDGFVAKLTDAGNSATFAWVRQLGGAGNDWSYGIAARGSSVYAVGSYGSAVASFGATALTNASNAVDGFVAKLTDAGSSATFAWAQSIGGVGAEEVKKVAVNGTAVVVAGIFSGPGLRFGTTALPIASAGDYDVFVAKLLDAGASPGLAWAQRAGGSGLELVRGVAIAGNSVYLTGSFASPNAAFGSTTLAAVVQSNSAYGDGYVAKLVDAGMAVSFAWAQALSGRGSDSVEGVAVNGSNVYVTGYFGYPTATMGAATLLNTGSNATNNVFVAKVVDSGNTSATAWGQVAGGQGDGGGASAIALQATAVLVAGGVTAVPLFSFGSIDIIGSDYSAMAFLATLTDPTLTLRDALGRTLRIETLPLPAAGQHHELDLRGLAPGIYTLQMQAGSSSGIQRLVVE
jgi:hypothetical protein